MTRFCAERVPTPFGSFAPHIEQVVGRAVHAWLLSDAMVEPRPVVPVIAFESVDSLLKFRDLSGKGNKRPGADLPSRLVV